MRVSLFLCAGLLAACNPKMDHDEVLAMVAPADGLIGGFKPGDRWEDIKAKHHPKLKVRDQLIGGSPMRQLRMDLDEARNGLYITFQVDAAGLVTSLDLDVHGERDNAVMVRRLDDELLDYYEKKLGKPQRCVSGACFFEVPGSNKRVMVGYSKIDGKPISGSITVRLSS